MPVSRCSPAPLRLCLAACAALLAGSPALAADGLCDSIRNIATLVPEKFASLEKDANGAASVRLPGATECLVKDGEYACNWSPVSDPAARAAELGKEIAACFPGSNLASMAMLGIHLVKTETATITVIGAMQDKLVMVSVK